MPESLSHISAITLFANDLPRSKRFSADTCAATAVVEDAASACVQFENMLLNLPPARAADALVSGSVMGGHGTPVQFSVWVDDIARDIARDIERVA